MEFVIYIIEIRSPYLSLFLLTHLLLVLMVVVDDTVVNACTFSAGGDDTVVNLTLPLLTKQMREK